MKVEIILKRTEPQESWHWAEAKSIAIVTVDAEMKVITEILKALKESGFDAG